MSDAVSRYKIKCHTVDAVAQSGGRRAVLKYVAEVTITLVAYHFCSTHSVAEVDAFFDSVGD